MCRFRCRLRRRERPELRPEDRAEQEPHKRAAEEYLTEKSHREIAGQGLQPDRNQFDPWMLEEQRGPEAHDGTHPCHSDAGPRKSDENGLIHAGRYHAKRDFGGDAVNRAQRQGSSLPESRPLRQAFPGGSAPQGALLGSAPRPQRTASRPRLRRAARA